jgi:hypothetical protein
MTSTADFVAWGTRDSQPLVSIAVMIAALFASLQHRAFRGEQ